MCVDKTNFPLNLLKTSPLILFLKKQVDGTMRKKTDFVIKYCFKFSTATEFFEGHTAMHWNLTINATTNTKTAILAFQECKPDSRVKSGW